MKTGKSGEKALTPGEYEQLLNACDSLDDRILIMLQVTLGLRRSDLVRIKINDIDLDNYQVLYREKKKGDRIRVLPIGEKLKQELQIYIKTLPKSQKTIFGYRSPRQSHNRFNSVVARSGIRPGEKIPIHALRATAAQFMDRCGWGVQEIAEVLGDSIRTVQEHYLVPSKYTLAETARDKEVVSTLR